MEQLEIVEQTAYDPALADDFDELVASLHMVDTYPHSPEEIQAVCEAAGSSLYLGMAGNVAVAMTTLIHPLVSMGHRTAIIEDVSVQRPHRAKGYGHAMLDFVVGEARQLDASRIELHSKDTRVASHRLYRDFGFEIFETNLFRRIL